MLFYSSPLPCFVICPKFVPGNLLSLLKFGLLSLIYLFPKLETEELEFTQHQRIKS